MGRDKALLPLGNDGTLLERALGVLGEVCDEVKTSGSHGGFEDNPRAVEDVYTDCGPLAGIHAALAQTEVDWNLFLAVDLPRVEPEHLRVLLDAPRTETTVGVMAQAGGRLHPLCGIYHRRLVAPIERALKAGERAVIPVLEVACAELGGDSGLVKVEFADESVFANLNTPEDVAIWMQAGQAGGKNFNT